MDTPRPAISSRITPLRPERARTVRALGHALVAAAVVGSPSQSALAQRTRPRAARPSPHAEGITVRARPPEPGSITHVRFRGAELTSTPGTGGDALRVVASQPGVARSPFGVGFYAVRGTSFENTGFLVDGFPVPILYHFAAGPSVLPNRLIGSLDFQPGGYALQYGRFSGGVVAIETHVPFVQGTRYEAELNIFSASIAATTRFGGDRGALSVSVRRSYYDLLLPIVFSDVKINFGDAQLRADYALTDRLRASVFFFGSTDVYDRSDQREEGGGSTINRDGFSYHFARAIGRLDYTGREGFRAQWSAMVGYDSVGYTAADTGRPETRVSYQGATVGTRASVRFAHGPALASTFGVDALAYVYDVGLSFPSVTGYAPVPQPQSNRGATYAQADITQSSVAPYFEEVLKYRAFEFVAGVRADVLQTNGRSFLLAEPRAVARYRINEQVSLAAASGLFHQAPPFFALVPLAGNPDLAPQRSWQSSVSSEVRLPHDFDARVTGYFSRLWNLPRATSTIVVRDGIPRRVSLTDDGEGTAFGLEFQLRRRLARGLFGWVSYTLARSERWVGDGAPVPAAQDQTHVLNLVGSWDINERWRLGARFSLSSGPPTNLVRGGSYDADANAFRADFLAEGERLPWFHQLDVRAEYRFRWNRARMTAYLDVLNTYYSQGTEGWVYSYDFGSRVPLRGLPILPVLGIRGEL